jgi:hypothetical protein
MPDLQTKTCKTKRRLRSIIVFKLRGGLPPVFPAERTGDRIAHIQKMCFSVRFAHIR